MTNGSTRGGGFLSPAGARWLPLLILAAGIVAYANSFQGVFLFDDREELVENRALAHVWPPLFAVAHPTRALADLTFAVNYAISGLTRADLHLTNLAIHLLAALFLFGIVRRTFQRSAFPAYWRDAAPGLAALTAIFWVVHPLQTESVTYLVQRHESLMGLMYMAALYAFIRAAEGQGKRWNIAAISICAVGMTSKEVMITAPVVMIIYDRLFVAESWSCLRRERGWLHLALGATMIIPPLLLVIASRTADLPSGSLLPPISPLHYLLTQIHVLSHYARLVFDPYPLCLDYQWPVVMRVSDVRVRDAVIVGIGLAATLWGLCRRRHWSFAAASFWIILAPTSSILPLPDPAVEHRMYLPSACLIVLSIGCVYAGFQRLTFSSSLPTKRLFQAMLGGIVLMITALLIVLTRNRNALYGSEQAMWSDVLRQRPGNVRAHIHLAGAQSRAGDPVAVERTCARLLSQLPDFHARSFEEIQRLTAHDPARLWEARYYALAHTLLGNAFWLKGDLDKAAASYRESIRLYPEKTAVYNLGLVLEQQGLVEQASEAWDVLVRLTPTDPEARQRWELSHQRKASASSPAEKKSASPSGSL